MNGKVLYVKYSNDRASEYAVRTEIVRLDDNKKVVRKFACYDEGLSHIDSLIDKYEALKTSFEDSCFVPNKACRITNGVELEYIEGVSLEDEIIALIETGEYELVADIIDKYVENINMVLKSEHKYIDYDLIFQNIIVDDDGAWNVIDYEWSIEDDISAKLLIYRAIWHVFYNYKDLGHPFMKKLFDRYAINPSDISDFEAFENDFQFRAYGRSDKRHIISDDLISVRATMPLEGEIWHNAFYPKALTEVEVFAIYDKDLVLSEHLIKDYNIGVDGIISLKVSLDFDIKTLRIDVSNDWCLFELISINIDEERILGNNGINLTDSLVLFNTSDPQIIVNTEGLNQRELVLIYRLGAIKKEMQSRITEALVSNEEKIEQLWATINKGKHTIMTQQDRINYLEASEAHYKNEVIDTIARYENSSSWKVTKPLRKISAVLKEK